MLKGLLAHRRRTGKQHQHNAHVVLAPLRQTTCRRGQRRVEPWRASHKNTRPKVIRGQPEVRLVQRLGSRKTAATAVHFYSGQHNASTGEKIVPGVLEFTQTGLCDNPVKIVHV